MIRNSACLFHSLVSACYGLFSPGETDAWASQVINADSGMGCASCAQQSDKPYSPGCVRVVFQGAWSVEVNGACAEAGTHTWQCTT